MSDSNVDAPPDLTKEQESLLNLPLDTANLVLEKLDPLDLLASRKVCQGLRTAIDMHGVSFDTITFDFSDDQSILDFDENEIKYSDVDNGTTVTYKDQEKRFENENFLGIAVKDLKTVWNNVSKLHIYNYAEDRTDIITSFINSLKSEKSVHVKQISLSNFSFNDVLIILQCLNEKTLETINLSNPSQTNQLAQITHLNQWKTAKNFELCNSLLDNSDQLEHLFHFEEFGCRTDVFSVENAIKVRDDLMKRSSFRTCRIYFNVPQSNPVDIAKVFKPDYAGGNEYSIEYSDDGNKFAIDCFRVGQSYRFSVRRC
ncbi:F-box domain-containing protein [Caenorhabditis elegans]|uniref:F-box domain-containing protein n=1 Tax=Caenorhabditis elegans TaxID=6239 RepID=O45159_CAEEL|nr:F-box domain-containing protein [Caenorhabditis elegans]CCD62958.1 F-box domain-containing protein [Caenorhabditis elegans]|eukprot:NP_503929.1 F-box A protein [Caenorhabditis elegans]